LLLLGALLDVGLSFLLTALVVMQSVFNFCYCSQLQNTRETAFALRKMPLNKAKRYLEDVLAHKQAIPFRRYCRGVGRTAQAKNRQPNGQGRWPAKSAQFVLDLLKNAESNAEVHNLTVTSEVLCSVNFIKPNFSYFYSTG
jgi:ribosomal protein uL22